MAIVNVTPDSFFDGGRSFDPKSLDSRIREVVNSGADIIDIGGCSSRPGAEIVPFEEELRRVTCGVESLRRISPDTLISIDTFRSGVVEHIVKEFGGVIVNDISAGELDARMVEVVSRYGLPYIAMHMRGRPDTMQQLTEYEDVVEDVIAYFERRCRQLRDAGVESIIIDPGFGFAKSLEQNYALLSSLDKLVELGYPVLVGVSRKSMIYKPLGVTAEDSLTGTIALNWEAMRQGASIIRVHDVRQMVEIRKLFEIFKRAKQ